MDNKMDTVSGTIVEMRVIAEGALSLFDKNPQPDTDSYSLIGEALYMLQERISYCLLASKQDEN